MHEIAFVDAHMHLWDLAQITHPWLEPPFSEVGPNGSVAAIASNYGIAEYRADTANWNLAGCVHIDAGAAAHLALAETRWLDELADSSGIPTGIVAFADLSDPDVERQLEQQASFMRVRGIRHIINWHSDPARTYSDRDLTQDTRWGEGFGKLSKYGLSFDLQCYPAQMTSLAKLLAQHEDTRVAINHLGMPVLTDRDGLYQWRAGIALLARLPQVSIKISGLGFIQRRWTVASMRPFIEEAVQVFGTDRCMLATDTPTDKLFAPLDVYLAAYREVLSSLSTDEQADIWGRNANRFYRLGLDI